MTAEVCRVTWDNEPATRLRAGDWEALVVPQCGAHLISLTNRTRGFDILRTPPTVAALREHPAVWGIPVLFPPNRIAEGRFDFDGREYRLPINEPNRGNHIHGLLLAAPWKVERLTTIDNTAEIGMVFEQNADSAAYKSFPAAFVFSLIYALRREGLVQSVRIENIGDAPMPVCLGFHTAFNIPFVAGTAAADYSLRVTIGDKRWEMDQERYLPSGKALPLNEREKLLKSIGIAPIAEPISAHYPAGTVEAFNGAELSCPRADVKLVYDVGAAYGHWVLWNGGGSKGFICPEPQTCMVNARNLRLPATVTGMISLAPGQTWQTSSEIRIEQIRMKSAV